MKIDNETQGQKQPAGSLPLVCLQRRGREGAGWSLGTQGQIGDMGGLSRRDLGFLCLGNTGTHKFIEKAAFNI